MIYENETNEMSIIIDASNAMLTAYVENDTQTICNILWSATQRLIQLVSDRWDGQSSILFPQGAVFGEDKRIVLTPCLQNRLDIAKYINARFLNLVKTQVEADIMERIINDNLSMAKMSKKDDGEVKDDGDVKDDGKVLSDW